MSARSSSGADVEEIESEDDGDVNRPRTSGASDGSSAAESDDAASTDSYMGLAYSGVRRSMGYVTSGVEYVAGRLLWRTPPSRSGVAKLQRTQSLPAFGRSRAASLPPGSSSLLLAFSSRPPRSLVAVKDEEDDGKFSVSSWRGGKKTPVDVSGVFHDVFSATLSQVSQKLTSFLPLFFMKASDLDIEGVQDAFMSCNVRRLGLVIGEENLFDPTQEKFGNDFLRVEQFLLEKLGHNQLFKKFIVMAVEKELDVMGRTVIGLTEPLAEKGYLGFYAQQQARDEITVEVAAGGNVLQFMQVRQLNRFTRVDDIVGSVTELKCPIKIESFSRYVIEGDCLVMSDLQISLNGEIFYDGSEDIMRLRDRQQCVQHYGAGF